MKHILYLAGRELVYPRNDVLLRAFRRFSHVDVVARRKKRPRSLLLNSLYVGVRALPYLLSRRYDLVFVGFYGHLIVRSLRPLIRAPLLFDVFLSTYDTLCYDRRVFAPDSPIGRAAFWLDRSSCNAATHLLLDTHQHADYFVRTFGILSRQIDILPVGCNEEIFTPRSQPAAAPTTRVFYYSTFQPLHGVETIVEAAALLTDTAIHVRLIGDGPNAEDVRRLAEKHKLSNVTFIPPVPIQVLADEMAAADVCLGGHFGHSEKAKRVIPGKIYQILAMQRPVIASDTPGNRELLQHNETAYLVPPEDPAALAAAIRDLHRTPALRTQLAMRGRALYDACCSEAVITAHVEEMVDRLMKS